MTAPAIPASPSELFHCDFYDLSLLGSACLRRQQSDPKDEENRHRWCAGGECEQGCRVWRALEGEDRPPAEPVEPAFNLPEKRHCSSCGRKLNLNNTSGVCSPIKGDPTRPGCRTRVENAPGRGPVEALETDIEVEPATPPSPLAPDPIEYRCEECSALLADGEEDVCTKCRAADADVAAGVAPPAAAAAPPEPVQPPPAEPEPRRAPPTPPARPAPIQRTKPMAEEKRCPYCNRLLRSDNKRGACSKCLAGGKPAPDAAAAAPKKPARPAKPPASAGNEQLELDGIPEGTKLPAVEKLPNSYLLQAVHELVRRRDELLAATRELGLADPVEPDAA